jgi:RHS repeat-associated protein
MTILSSDPYSVPITQPRTIVVATATSGCNLRYTLNGATPTQTIGTLIASGGTVTVTPSPGGTVLKVIAYKTGWTDSIVHSATYYYGEGGGGGPSPTVAPTATATATPTATATATATPPAPPVTATPASQVSTPTFNPDGGTWLITQQRTVTVTTSTIGANMRYTINGAPPTSTTGTLISGSSGTVTVTPSPLGATLRVIAYKAGMIDSQVHEAVFYYENENGGNSNMAQPIDGGPGGGGVVIDGGDQPTISYDNNGNLIHYKEWNYRYDAQNRLTEAWNGTTTAQFYYDGKNRQIARRIGGDIRFSSWDNWELLEEYASGLTVVKGYLQGATGVIKSWDPIYGQLYYYQDKLGSTTHVANAIGQLVESYHYDLTGTPSYFNSTSQPINSSTVAVADLYAGERWIPELRLYDLRNRFMSPELGRFLQPDPIGFQGDGSNLYRYCGNDPVDRSDPTGLFDMWSNLTKFYIGNPSMDVVNKAWNDRLQQLDSAGGFRKIPREQAEREMSPGSPLPESDRALLNNGCNGLTSVYQGKGENWPENALGTKAYPEESQAHSRVVGENQRNFVFAKQGTWRTSRPKPNPTTGEIPRTSITSDRLFNYMVYMPATHSYAWMDHGAKAGPQSVRVSNAPNPNSRVYPETIWFSTPIDR